MLPQVSLVAFIAIVVGVRALIVAFFLPDEVILRAVQVIWNRALLIKRASHHVVSEAVPTGRHRLGELCGA